ncbi:hypothetical protein KA478_04730 [Patescibacteria group bacterium]|nr:hypothetical protein [Patescibacteria group bacterium]
MEENFIEDGDAYIDWAAMEAEQLAREAALDVIDPYLEQMLEIEEEIAEIPDIVDIQLPSAPQALQEIIAIIKTNP